MGRTPVQFTRPGSEPNRSNKERRAVAAHDELVVAFGHLRSAPVVATGAPCYQSMVTPPKRPGPWPGMVGEKAKPDSS